MAALIVSVGKIGLVLRVVKPPNSEPQMTENTPGVVIAAKKITLQTCYFRLLI